MKPLLDRLRADLFERRLWPVVALLAVALVAVPVLLRQRGGEPAEAAAPPVPAVPATGKAAPDPAATARAVSSVLGATARDAARGAARDPFRRPAAQRAHATSGSNVSTPPPAAASPAPSASLASAPPPVSPSSSSSFSPPVAHSVQTGPAAPASRLSGAEPSHARTYRLRRADIRFGTDLASPLVRDAVRLRAFPSAKAPAALYLGVTDDGARAAFAITGGAQVSGDGACRPRKRLCTHLLLKPGERAFLTAGGVRYRLALVRIRTDETTSKARAERFYARESRVGRCVLDVTDYLGYDETRGTVAAHPDAGRCRYVIDPAGTVGAR